MKTRAFSPTKQLFPRLILLFCLLTSVLLSYYTLWYQPRYNVAHQRNPHSSRPQNGALDPILSPLHSTHRSSSLGVAEEIYVVSLPHRTDRRQDMEVLRSALGLTWQYADGVPSHSPAIQMVAERVRLLRLQQEAKPFAWPKKLLANVTSSLATPIPPSGSDLWLQSLLAWTPQQPPLDTTIPLTCSTEDNKPRPYTSRIGPHDLLTTNTLACWESHLRVIRHVANSSSPTTPNTDKGAAAIILEDDVDMEYDIRDRLTKIWPSLPSNWDIVFLGHCWSNEAHNPPISLPSLSTRLHPSHRPKCTHAYALSHTGARRIYAHLTTIPFAYSRAIDQALAWLVSSGRIRAFSVVPSVVVQRRVTMSDVVPGLGMGSRWRDELMRGVLDVGSEQEEEPVVEEDEELES